MGLSAAIGGAIGNIAGGLISNNQNRREAERNRNFQREMSNTSHQREVEDLKKAGLNPLLSATGGSGASTPAGGQAAMDNAIGPGISSALEGIRLRKDIAMTDAQIGLSEAQKEAAKSTALKDATTAKNIAAQTNVLETQMPMIQSESRAKKKQYDWDSKAADYDNVVQRIQSGLGSIPSPKNFNKIPKRN